MKLTIRHYILLTMFILSQNLIWELLQKFISREYIQNSILLVFQILFSNLYILFGIFFTADNERFVSFWERNKKMYNIFDKILNWIIVIIFNFYYYIFVFYDVFLNKGSKIVTEEFRIEVRKKIIEYNSDSIQARCLCIPFVISVISIVICFFCSTKEISYYKEIINTVSALIGFGFLFTGVTSKPIQRMKKNVDNPI